MSLDVKKHIQNCFKKELDALEEKVKNSFEELSEVTYGHEECIEAAKGIFFNFIDDMIDCRAKVELQVRKEYEPSFSDQDRSNLDEELKRLVQEKVSNNKKYFSHITYNRNDAFVLHRATFDSLKDKIESAIRRKYGSGHDIKTEEKIKNELEMVEFQLNSPKDKNKDFDFPFINETKLIPLLKRDWVDIEKCRANKCWKAVIILCGSFLEAVLYDVLKQKESQAMRTQTAIKVKKSLEVCTLENYIDMSHDLNILTKGTQNFSHGLRDYRNLIHPQKEIAENYSVGESVANASFESLKVALEDVKKFFKP